MSVTTFEVTDFTKPAYLHFNNEKFWEITLNDSKNETTIRCGRLINKKEDTTTVQVLSKSHENLVESISYMEKHVNTKLSKGYRFFKVEIEKIDFEFLQPQNPPPKKENTRPSYAINILPPESLDQPVRNLKRRNEDELVRPDLKQPKMSPVVYSGDKDIDEAIALSILEEKRRQRNGMQIESMSTNDTESSQGGGSQQILPSFKGEFLVKGDLFCKIQVLRKYLKIEKGWESNPELAEKEFSVCADGPDAIKQAQKLIGTWVTEGYKPQSHKFKPDFKESELDVMLNFNHHSGGNGSDDDDNDNKLDTLDVGGGRYSDTSRMSGMYAEDEDYDDPNDEDFTTTVVSSRKKSRSRARSASVSVAGDDDRDEDIEDDDGPVADLGPDPLGKPITKNYTSVLLAHKWESEDPKGWYVSEKLDGVRCFWNGKTMWSRNGKQFFPPKFFIKHFPKSPLDGELWTGRSNFQRCVSYVRKNNPIDSEWKKVKYMVFDAPELKLPFKDRYKKMKEVFGKIKSPYIKLHEHQICKGREHLDDELGVVQNLGGEGLMIRNPNSHYECRRSRSLLKVKTFEDDEAVIIGHEPGSGKYLGQCGSLRVRNGKGVEFSVGSGMNDAMRARPPKIGTKITYKHQGVSDRGIPRFPTFLRIYQGV